MTTEDERHEQHRETIRFLSRPGGALDKDGPHSSLNNPAWFMTSSLDVPRRVRADLWDELLTEARREHPGARREGKAIVMAGPPGAGKSTVRQNVLGVDESAWLIVDADDFKTKLLREAMADGSYEGFFKPEEVRRRELDGEPFFPLELASLVHEESSLLAKALRDEALENGTNVVLDTVLSSPERAVALGADLDSAGYKIEVVDVEVPFDVSQQMIAKRWREAYENAVATGSGLGGRWVPSVYAHHVFDTDSGRARSQESAEALARETAGVMRLRRFWRSSVDASPRVELDLGRLKPGGELLPYEVVAARAKQRSERAIAAKDQGRQAPRREGPTAPGIER